MSEGGLNPNGCCRSSWDEKAILKFVLEVGYAMIRSGAETFRSEDTCRRLLEAYQMQQGEVFVLANFLSISFQGRSGQVYHAQKRISNRRDNLRYVDELNALARQYCQNPADPQSGEEAVLQIMQTPGYPLYVQPFITGSVGLTFSLMLGSNLAAGLYAFVLGSLMRLCIMPFQAREVNKVFINILGGMLVTFFAVPCRYFGLADEMGRIVAGCSMYLFPGISLMNSIRDIIASDYLAGITRLVETILVATSIALGSGLALSLLAHLS